MKKRARSRHLSRYVSRNADNRHFCLAIQRQKFCYETKAKAELACSFSNNKQRVYYCESCCAYHTTHFSESRYKKSYARKRTEKIYDHINNLATNDTTDAKIKNFRKERIKTEKEKLKKEDNVIQRYISCRLIHQLQSGESLPTSIREELAKIVNFDVPGAEECFEKTIASNILIEKYAIVIYLLYRMEGGNGLVYDSMSDMIADSFIELSEEKRKHVLNFLMALYNAGIIYIKKDVNDKRVYYLKETIPQDEIMALPDDCIKYFRVAN